MIHFIREGDNQHDGLNVVSVSDGGFALSIKWNKHYFYFRRRGISNPVKPRHYWQSGSYK